MALLSDAVRAQISARFQSDKSLIDENIPQLSKAELLAVISEIDSLMDVAQAALLAGLPDEAAALPSSQIAELCALVAEQRLANQSTEQQVEFSTAMSAKVQSVQAGKVKIGG
jgi:hypothetical protein